MNLSYDEQKAAVAAEIAKFPSEFGLRGFRGERFRVSEAASYYSSSSGVVLYTERLERRDDASQWLSFAKGSPEELRAQVVRL